MSEKKVIPVVIEDYSFTNRVIRAQMEKNGTISTIKTFIKKKLLLKKQRFLVFFGPKKAKRFQELKKTNLDSLWQLAEKDEVTLQIRRQVDLSKIKTLRKDTSLREIDLPVSVLKVDNVSPQETRYRMQGVARTFLEEIANDPKNATFRIPSRSSDNVGYDDNSQMVLLGSHVVDRQFRHLSSVQSVVQLTGLMRYVSEILETDKHATKRHLFYRDVNLFGNQRVSDGLIEDLGALLRVSRHSLNVIASAKGKVIGRLEFIEGGDKIDCTKGLGGHAITPMLDQVSDFQSDAEF
ncbi:MAG: hypothetical protein ACXACR_14265, partial [Candidatus Hodarchaeales archaeon]